jgi:dTDP-D-glucose 4,6-dehydratase
MEGKNPIKPVVVTGGCGFTGAGFVGYVLETDPRIGTRNGEALTYAGNPDNLADLHAGTRYHTVHRGSREIPVAETAGSGVRCDCEFSRQEPRRP